MASPWASDSARHFTSCDVDDDVLRVPGEREADGTSGGAGGHIVVDDGLAEELLAMEREAARARRRRRGATRRSLREILREALGRREARLKREEAAEVDRRRKVQLKERLRAARVFRQRAWGTNQRAETPLSALDVDERRHLAEWAHHVPAAEWQRARLGPPRKCGVDSEVGDNTAVRESSCEERSVATLESRALSVVASVLDCYVGSYAEFKYIPAQLREALLCECPADVAGALEVDEWEPLVTGLRHVVLQGDLLTTADVVRLLVPRVPHTRMGKDIREHVITMPKVDTEGEDGEWVPPEDEDSAMECVFADDPAAGTTAAYFEPGGCSELRSLVLHDTSSVNPAEVLRALADLPGVGGLHGSLRYVRLSGAAVRPSVVYETFEAAAALQSLKVLVFDGCLSGLEDPARVMGYLQCCKGFRRLQLLRFTRCCPAGMEEVALRNIFTGLCIVKAADSVQVEVAEPYHEPDAAW